MYWIPDQTIAPTAKSAPYWSIVFATLTTVSFILVIPPPPILGSTAHWVHRAHSLNKVERGVFEVESNLQSPAAAKTKLAVKNEIRMQRKIDMKRIF